MLAFYLTHAEVVSDPDVPTPLWGLSDKGRARIEAFAARHVLPAGIRIVASTERKALDTADIIAAATGSAIESYPEFGENDRSSTGYLVPDAFEAHVRELFADPDRSVAGWETARHAQDRIVGAVMARMEDDILFVGHGCVGTLLKCHVGRRPIAQSEDQRALAAAGGGNIFAFTRDALLSDWQPIESFGR
jgi:broad specificity phosphatase PhoE